MTTTPPNRAGSTFVVTGGTGGLGYFTAERLAATGARVVLTARDVDRGVRAIDSIRWHVPRARVEAVALDLTDPASVRRAADEIAEIAGPAGLDALVLNAGSTTPPRERTLTTTGLEVTVATNVVGHAALTGHLWSSLTTAGRAGGDGHARPARVVGLGSLATRIVPFDPAALVADHAYRPFRTYALSKHAMHAFVLELARRADADERGAGVRSLLAHPGYAVDGLSPARPGIVVPGRFERLPFAQGKHEGARPTLRAVLDPALPNGAFVGPRWTTWGAPVRATPVASSASREAGAAVWELLERWTGGALPRLGASPAD
jgi:NAD(P)-dependent dehydrogenase (short-subunit alcohol dehydrogenase family)